MFGLVSAAVGIAIAGIVISNPVSHNELVGDVRSRGNTHPCRSHAVQVSKASLRSHTVGWSGINTTIWPYVSTFGIMSHNSLVRIRVNDTESVGWFNGRIGA